MTQGINTSLNSPYLRIQDLQRLRNLGFAGRHAVQGIYAGRHSSSQRGHSVEFSDYREYIPGDEVGDVDWKVYARSDRMFIKLFEHQSDMLVHVLVDGSASMAYGEKGMRKYDQACLLAGAISFLTLNQQDKIGLALAHEGLGTFIPPVASMRQMPGLLQMMEAHQPKGEANLADAVQGLLASAGRRSLIIIMSDLLEEDETLLKSIHLLRERGNEVIVFQVMHPDELDLPSTHRGVFKDAESGVKMSIAVDDIRKAYRERMQAFTQGWQRKLRQEGIDYTLARTDKHYVELLEGYLFIRNAIKG